MTQQTEAMPYDPAVDTVLFEISLMLSIIDHSRSLCPGCKRSMCELIRRASERRLDREPDLVGSSPSRIRQISRNAAGSLQFSSTLAARPVTFVSWGLVKWLLRPGWDADAVDATVTALSEPGDDAWNLAQCKLWHALGGQYNLVDAVQGRPLADFMRAHMTLLNALRREPERPGPERHPCERRDRVGRSACFPEVPRAYPYGGDVARQTNHAVASALDCLDASVAEIVWHALVEDWARRERGLGVRPCQEGDEIAVVAALEQTPAFKARLLALGRGERYKSLEELSTSTLADWRSPAVRDAVDPDHEPHPVAMGVHLTCEGAATATFDESLETNLTRKALNLMVDLLTGTTRPRHDDVV